MGLTANVIVWAADLEAGRLPGISALSGVPATAARRYRFATAPAWTMILIVAGIAVGVGWVPGIIVRALVAKRAAGKIPMTEQEKRRIGLRQWMPWGLLGLTLALIVGGAVIAGQDETAGGVLVVLGLLAMVLFIVVLLVVMITTRPKGIVRDVQPGVRSVELQRVHPAFAAAVTQMYQQSGYPAVSLPAPAGDFRDYAAPPPGFPALPAPAEPDLTQ